MADAAPPHGPRGWPSDQPAGGDVWGPATAVRSGGGSAAPASPSRPDGGRDGGAANRKPAPPLQYRSPIPDASPNRRRSGRDDLPGRDDHDAWGGDPRAAGASAADPYAADRYAANPRTAGAMARTGTDERGLPGWAGLVLLLVIAGIGGLIDSISGAQVRGGFNIGIIVASIVAILAVRRSGMFPVVVAPPLVYAGASGAMLYLRSGGLHDRKVLFDAAANWLVYGFPAIAAATAAVLIIAGIRLVVRR